jgi:predicted anti-sigma-YlaC factor YlaD
MREEFDKEIDSLLRRRARTAAVARPRGNGADASQTDAHLDADCLSAYAEGALPAPARVAAASHLADCDECRSTVVRLSRAAGVEGELERRAAVPASAASAKHARRREWLAALFAPRVLRYAAPVVALSLVAAVAFVALRSRRGEERLAQQAANAAAPRADITSDQKVAETNGALQSSSAAAANANASMTANANASAPEGATGSAANHNAASFGDAASEQSKESPAGGGSSASAESKAGETAEDKLDRAAEPPSPAKDQPAAAPAEKAPSSETVEVAKTETRSKAGPPSETENNQVAAEQSPKQQQRSTNLARGLEVQSPDGSRNQTRAGVNNTSNNAAGAGGYVAGNTREERDRSGAATSAPSARRRSADEKKAKSEENRAETRDDEDVRTAQTRSVAGHSFRRAGGAWVDVNYKPSMSSTGVRRGTDSYRALVADIPELGRVAEQLSGEVVVVIRGRAYRIR